MLGALLDRLRHQRRKCRWSPDQATGRRGEDLAHRYLKRHGFTILARNYRLSSGEAEADIIAMEAAARDAGTMEVGQGHALSRSGPSDSTDVSDAPTLVIVEVKTREDASHGPPDRAIGPDKQRHLIRLARHYARKRNHPWEHVRIDVVTVLLALGSAPQIEHHRAAVPLPR